jgi:hypothetical protein
MFGEAVVLVAGLIFLVVETDHLMHQGTDAPKQVHREHQEFPAPEKPGLALAAPPGRTDTRITPETGQLELATSAPFMA